MLNGRVSSEVPGVVDQGVELPRIAVVPGVACQDPHAVYGSDEYGYGILLGGDTLIVR